MHFYTKCNGFAISHYFLFVMIVLFSVLTFDNIIPNVKIFFTFHCNIHISLIKRNMHYDMVW